MKYDILTEHPTMFWFPMIINEYTAEFQSTKTSKDAKFKQCLYLKLPPPLVMSRTDAQNTLYSIFKTWSHGVRYTTRILWCIINNYWMIEVYCDMKIINIEVRVISKQKARMITLTETLIILHITKTESNNCFIIHFQWGKP